MGSLAALLLATPIFGLALAPPPALAPAGVSLAAPAALTVAAPAAPIAVAPAPRAGSPPLQAADEVRADAETMRRRAGLAKLHRPLGLSTWAAMGGTLVLGTIQYYNLYGFFAGLEDTPCATGDAIFGQGQCSGTPWPHLISAMATTALYATTLTLALLMPDPGGLSDGQSEFARNLRLHRLLRWIHLGGMVAQIALGIVAANADSFGLDRAQDFGTLQALSTVHLGLGLATFGTLTWAALLML